MLAVGGVVKGVSDRRGVIDAEKRAHLFHIKLRLLAIHAGGVDGGIEPNEINLIAVAAPGGKGATAL